jgi:UDP-N-acetylmuramate dehydrogenase
MRAWDNCGMNLEKNVALQALNSFGIVARAQQLVRIANAEDLRAVLVDPVLSGLPKFVLGGGSNIVLTGDVKPLVLKVEIMGRQVLLETDKHVIVQAGAGENWHEFVRWTVEQGLGGLENMALIPGTVGATPVQNVGAYGVETQDRMHSLDALHLDTGESFSLEPGQCGFGYRDSVFKHAGGLGLRGKALITHVRFALSKPWRADLSYLDLQRKQEAAGVQNPSLQQVFDWVCDIRRAKLPDPALVGNAGSFFKNPTVTPEQCQDIIAREPKIVHYPMPDGNVKLAAGWLIDACGWKGKSVGNASVYEKQALVLINRGGATGGEVVTLAKAIQTSVYERFGIMLEPEPVVV